MTARATITAAAMTRAIEAAKQGCRVEIKPDGTLIVEPPREPREDDDIHGTQPIDLVTWKPGQ